MVLLQLEDPSELFVKRREFPPISAFLSRRDMTVMAYKTFIEVLDFVFCIYGQSER